MIITNKKSWMRKIKDDTNVHSNIDNDNEQTIDHDDEQKWWWMMTQIITNNGDWWQKMNNGSWWMMVCNDKRWSKMMNDGEWTTTTPLVADVGFVIVMPWAHGPMGKWAKGNVLAFSGCGEIFNKWLVFVITEIFWMWKLIFKKKQYINKFIEIFFQDIASKIGSIFT